MDGIQIYAVILVIYLVVCSIITDGKEKEYMFHSFERDMTGMTLLIPLFGRVMEWF